MIATSFRHHEYPTHYPLLYTPLIVITIFLPNVYTFTMVTAVYLHFITDMFYTSDGIRWLAPFNKKFFQLMSKKTLNIHGAYWAKVYMGTPFYFLEFGLLGVAGFLFWWNHFTVYQAPTWCQILIGVLLAILFIGLFFFERWRSGFTDRLLSKNGDS